MTMPTADTPAALAALDPNDPPTVEEFKALLRDLIYAYATAVHRNGYIAGIDSVSSWHEEDEADEETPKAALLKYLHDIETRCDPAGEVQRVASLEEQVAGLTAKLTEATNVR